MKYKVGDRVKIQSLERYNKYKNRYGDINYGCETEILFTSEMSSFCGQVVTITRVRYIGCVRFYHLVEDNGAHLWVDGMFEGLVEEESIIDLTVKGEEIKERIEIAIPEGYEYVIESGKIIFTKKKKEYPKIYEECCTVLHFHYDHYLTYDDEKDINPTKEEEEFIDLMDVFSRLIVCRNAYWKIYGEENGLGKPWEPTNDKYSYIITRCCNEITTYRTAGNSVVFEFPTEEMRDAFKENFKEEIEKCKELL